MLHFLILLAYALTLPRLTLAANCPDAGVVVVASVFATLAVVFIVLAIAGFLIWKRRKAILKPEKHDVTEKGENGKYGFTNQAFDRDSEAVEGIPGYVPYRDIDQEKSSFHASRDLAKKTWSSLPPCDMPDVRQRKSSLGSLDRNKFANEENTVEVWLTSQDFIGLGFNIAGSMRDGIFVSQVHNRGPAKESGKFKVGDRIMSVNISFENMVYEDALTILSYASPYPVRVTLQKQSCVPRNRKLSDVRTNLNHPLYRSHSVDVLNVQSTREPVFHPRRAASEMRGGKNESPAVQRVSKRGFEGNITEESSVSVMDNDVFETNATSPKTNAVVHRTHSGGKDKLDFGREVSILAETDLPNATIDLNHAELQTRSRGSDVISNGARFSDPFENLTEQDKLDMLRLSYADPDAVPDTSFDNEALVSPSFAARGIPVKPERKKKRSSATSTPSQSDVEFSASTPSSPKSATAKIAVEEEMKTVLLPPTEAPPPVPEDETEVQEEEIMPEVKHREVSVSTDKIQLAPVTAELDTSDISVDKTLVADNSLLDLSLSENDVTVVHSEAQETRAESPEGDAALEDTIAATQVDKNYSVPKNWKIFAQNEIIDKADGTHEKDNVDGDQFDIADNRVSNKNGDTEFDKDLPELDMNLNFDTDSVLFKESFPKRNTKEKENSVAYDISVTELNALEQKVREEERKKAEKQQTKAGGIAFEIRDDYTTGTTRFVNANSVHRTASYDINLGKDRSKDYEISQRPTSFKGEMKARDEMDSGMLDWSGKRLVRAGSFTEIPQGDSDWTEEQNLSEEDSLMEQMIKEDSKSPVMKQLTKATLVPSRSKNTEDNERNSESDSQCHSLSESSDDTENAEESNRNENGENSPDTSLDSTPEKIAHISDMKSKFVSSVS